MVKWICDVQCRGVGWCPWLRRGVGWSPSSGPGGESHTGSPWGSTGKEPPLHRRRATAGSGQGWKSTQEVKRSQSHATRVYIHRVLLPPSGYESIVTQTLHEVFFFCL